jgi:hypothetical protein
MDALEFSCIVDRRLCAMRPWVFVKRMVLTQGRVQSPPESRALGHGRCWCERSVHSSRRYARNCRTSAVKATTSARVSPTSPGRPRKRSRTKGSAGGWRRQAGGGTRSAISYSAARAKKRTSKASPWAGSDVQRASGEAIGDHRSPGRARVRHTGWARRPPHPASGFNMNIGVGGAADIGHRAHFLWAPAPILPATVLLAAQLSKPWPSAQCSFAANR